MKLWVSPEVEHLLTLGTQHPFPTWLVKSRKTSKNQPPPQGVKSVRRFCWKGDRGFLIAPFGQAQVSWIGNNLAGVIRFLGSLARRCPGDLRWLSSFGVTARSLLTAKATHANQVLLSPHTFLSFSVSTEGVIPAQCFTFRWKLKRYVGGLFAVHCDWHSCLCSKGKVLIFFFFQR